MAENAMSDNNLLRMQQEAIRRVRLMQERATHSVQPERSSGTDASETAASAPGVPGTAAAQKSRSTAFAAAGAGTPVPGTPGGGTAKQNFQPENTDPVQNALFSSQGILSFLKGGDSESILLLVLLLILADEKADPALLLAILYLLL